MGGFFNLGDITSIVRGDEHQKTRKEHDCRSCGRYAKCKTPKAPAVGEGKKGILIIGDALTELEDKSSNESHGTHYKFIKRALAKQDIDIEEDCWYTHAIRCHSKDKVGAIVSSACHRKLMEEITRLKPKVIVTTSYLAFDILLHDRLSGRAAIVPYFDWCGHLIPDQKLKRFIVPLYDTKMMLAEQDERVNRFELFYKEQLSLIDKALTTSFPTYNLDTHIRPCLDRDSALKAIKDAMAWKRFAFDYEATGIKPHRKGHEILYASISNGELSYSFQFYNDPEFLLAWKNLLLNDAIKIAHNQSYERSWTLNILGYEPNRLIHDPMLAQHCLDNKAPTGLKFLTYVHYGFLGYDFDIDPYISADNEEQKKYGANSINNMKKAPKGKTLEYNAMDSLFTYWLCDDIVNALDVDHQYPGYKFFMEAQIALDAAHQTGIPVDMEVLNKSKEFLSAEIDKLYKKIMDDDLILHKWDGGKYGSDFNPKSDDHVRHLLFDILSFPVYSRTDSGLPTVDEDALLSYRDTIPLVTDLLLYRQWNKALNTYIAQAEREIVGATLRSFFHLNKVKTYRSGSRDVNFQNQPKHNKEVMGIIRSLYVAPHGYRIKEYDFKGAEVACAAAVTGDENLIKYVSDLSTDMHRDLACGLFFLTPEQVNKKIRGELTKGPWTFAQFYGSWYKQCADNIWALISAPSAKEQYGLDIIAHLEDNGIVTQEDWVKHCEKQESVLWDDFFPGYKAFREKTYENFRKKGYIDYVNGFRYYGPATKNECLNAPVQGPAFHIQLWAFTQITKELKKRNMKSRLIFQIHDSMGILVAEEEREYVDHLVWLYATQKVREHWPWITVPLMIEHEQSELGGSWAKMESLGFLKGDQ